MDAPSMKTYAELMRNIAETHGDYDRSVGPMTYQEAASLGFDANRLKILADRWLQNVEWNKPDVDYQDPKYRNAGCEDLNVPGAMGAVGVMFLEGVPGENSYFTALKGKLQAAAMQQEGVGHYLSAAMDGAWERESALLNPGFLDIAFTRFQTIQRMWMSSREFLLTAKLLRLALACLSACDFSPASIRANKERYARYIRLAAWFIDSAVITMVTNASRTVANDPDWTEYKDFIRKWLESEKNREARAITG